MGESGSENLLAEAMSAMTAAVQAQTKVFSDGMSRQESAVGKLTEKIDDVQTRLIRLEEQQHGASIKALSDKVERIESRVHALEVLRAQAVGVGVVMGWARNWAPVLAAIVLAIIAIYGVEHKLP